MKTNCSVCKTQMIKRKQGVEGSRNYVSDFEPILPKWESDVNEEEIIKMTTITLVYEGYQKVVLRPSGSELRTNS